MDARPLVDEEPFLDTLDDIASRHHIGYRQHPSDQDDEARGKPFAIEKHSNDENNQSECDGFHYAIGFLPETPRGTHTVESLDCQNKEKKRRHRQSETDIVFKRQIEHFGNVCLKLRHPAQEISGSGRQKNHHEINRDLDGAEEYF